LAEKLRSLFTLFASHIVQHAASILEKNNNTKEGEVILINKNYKISLSQIIILHYYSEEITLDTRSKQTILNVRGAILSAPP